MAMAWGSKVNGQKLTIYVISSNKFKTLYINYYVLLEQIR